MQHDGYAPGSPVRWDGRVDDQHDRAALRWHQVVEPLDLWSGTVPDGGRGFCFLGYASDRGVERNLGRPGAARGPDAIRDQLSDLPVTFTDGVRLFDGGDIRCGGDVERSQETLADAVARILGLGLFPVVLGGGHDLAFGHWCGVRRSLPCSTRLGVVNLDAHLDLRSPVAGANSGTSFAQIAERCVEWGDELCYLCLGVQRSANTVRLMQRAEDLGVDWVLADEIEPAGDDEVDGRIDAFLDRLDTVYLTVDADVMSSAFVPGVSAPQPLGLAPQTVLSLVRRVVSRGTTVSFDVAEVSPRFDDDDNSAKVAAVLIGALVEELLQPDQRIA
jgi:formiminoglutamase